MKCDPYLTWIHWTDMFLIGSWSIVMFWSPFVLLYNVTISIGRLQKISIPIPWTAFGNSEGKGGALNWKSNGMGTTLIRIPKAWGRSRRDRQESVKARKNWRPCPRESNKDFQRAEVNNGNPEERGVNGTFRIWKAWSCSFGISECKKGLKYRSCLCSGSCPWLDMDISWNHPLLTNKI